MMAQLPFGASTNGMDAGGVHKRMALGGADTQKKRMKLIIAETERRVGPDIDMLKELQRTDPIGKEQWWAFVDTHGEGVRDPGKHPASFVQDFLDKYSAGMRFTSPRVNMMPELVKEGERRSNFFKEAWVSYCGTFGSGMKDPSKHDENYLVGFMDFLGQRGWMALTAARTGRMPASAMPQVPQQSSPLVARGDQSLQYNNLGVAGFGSPVGAAMGTSLAEQLLGPPRLQATSHLLGSAAVAAPTSGVTTGYGDSLASSAAAAGSLYGAAPGAMTAALPSTAGGALSSAAYGGSMVASALPGTMPGIAGGDVSNAYNLSSAYGAGALSSAYSSLAGTSPALGAGAAYSGYAATSGAHADPTAAAYAAALGQHTLAAYAAAASQQAAAAGASGYDALSSQIAAALQAYAVGYQAVAGAGAPAAQAYATPGVATAAAAPQAYALPGAAAGSAVPQAYASPGTAVTSQTYAAPGAAAPPQQYAAAAATPDIGAPAQVYAAPGAAGTQVAAIAPQADAAQGTVSSQLYAASGVGGAPQEYSIHGAAPGQAAPPQVFDAVGPTTAAAESPQANMVAAAPPGASEVAAAPAITQAS